jgi:hypothetical protein
VLRSFKKVAGSTIVLDTGLLIEFLECPGIDFFYLLSPSKTRDESIQFQCLPGADALARPVQAAARMDAFHP